jgi:tRNA-specific 2-thiouridylase
VVVQTLRPGAIPPGDIDHIAGRVWGRHDGIIHYTIGQRKGLGIGGQKGDQGDPLYVVRLDPARHRVVVGPKSSLARDRVLVREVNWLGSGEAPDADGTKVHVKLRSAQPVASATAFPTPNGGAEVILDEPQFGVAPGQACVFYQGDRVLGGGWIASAESRLAAP